MRLSRKALDILWNASEKYTVAAKDEQAWVFDVRPVNGRLVGEDIHICHVLREHGVDIWLDPHIVSGHSGMKRWTGSFADWLGRAQIEAQLRGELVFTASAGGAA
jgi:hypothetical protein